jgi:hypothetical protein
MSVDILSSWDRHDKELLENDLFKNLWGGNVRDEYKDKINQAIILWKSLSNNDIEENDDIDLWRLDD